MLGREMYKKYMCLCEINGKEMEFIIINMRKHCALYGHPGILPIYAIKAQIALGFWFTKQSCENPMLVSRGC